MNDNLMKILTGSYMLFSVTILSSCMILLSHTWNIFNFWMFVFCLNGENEIEPSLGWHYIHALLPSPPLPLHVLISSCRNRLCSSCSLTLTQSACLQTESRTESRNPFFETLNLWLLSRRWRRRTVVKNLRLGFFLEGYRLGGGSKQGKRRPNKQRQGCLCDVLLYGTG